MDVSVHSTTSARLAAGLVAVALLAPACRAPRVPAARVSRQRLAPSLVVSGRVMPPVRVNIGTTVLGTVTRRLVEEGERVAAGQVLLRLDAAEAEAARRQSQAAVQQAEAALAQLRGVGEPVLSAALAQARAVEARAVSELQRAEGLAGWGLITTSQLEEARKTAEVGRGQARAAEAQHAGSRPRGVDERVAQAQLAAARAAQAAAEARLAHAVIRAPAPGLVIARRVEAGDVVQPGQVLFELAVDGPTLLTTDPDEKNLPGLEMGQAALASADAFPGSRFAARVSFIGAAVDRQRGTVEVRLTVPAPPAHLRPDMTVSVELQGTQRDDALVVPSEAVRDVTGRAPWVLVVSGGRVERRDVRVGWRGDALSEVTSGLRDGEWVVSSVTGPGPGTRVRAETAGR